jgi:hypothetical protein
MEPRKREKAAMCVCVCERAGGASSLVSVCLG